MYQGKEERLNWSNYLNLNSDEIEEKAQEILGNMTIKEKLNQLQADWSTIKMGIKFALKGYCGTPIPAGKCKRLGIPPILFVDGPRGLVSGEGTCFPVSMARGASWDLDLEERIGNAIGNEGRARGANYFGGVCINLLRHPAWGRAQETYGEDTFHLGMFGSALTKGIQNHMMACAKHYACNSMENARFKVNVIASERVLREIYLSHFKKCIDVGVDSIMSAYNKVNGFYCGFNTQLLRDILKKDWNYNGFVISDFLFGTRNGLASILNGLDIEYPSKLRRPPRKIMKWYKKGKITDEIIDDSVLRILRKKLVQAQRPGDENYPKSMILSKENIALALEAAENSIVLLKNEGYILPLAHENKNKKVKKIALLGPLSNYKNIGDHGSSNVSPPYTVTPFDGLKKQIDQINDSSANTDFELLNYDGKNLDVSIEIAKKSDIVIIVVGYAHSDEGEFLFPLLKLGGDRSSITLNKKDEELIEETSKVNSKTIVIMIGGSSIITEKWRNKVSGIIMAWYGGMEGGTALANMIFGKINPSGKLPCVFVKSENQLPYFDRNAKEIEYDYYHGYLLMDKNGWEPAFSFGFGLSYTTYHYSNLKIKTTTLKGDTIDTAKNKIIDLSVDVSNTGDIDGEEIIQMYVSYKNSEVERHTKELKGFTKKLIKAGETKTVILQLYIKDLAYYNEDRKEWVIEDIDYTILVGSSSKKEDLLSVNFKL